MAAAGRQRLSSIVHVFWLLLVILVLAIPLLSWTSIRFPPASRSLIAYVVLMALALVALRVT